VSLTPAFDPHAFPIFYIDLDFSNKNIHNTSKMGNACGSKAGVSDTSKK